MDPLVLTLTIVSSVLAVFDCVGRAGFFGLARGTKNTETY